MGEPTGRYLKTPSPAVNAGYQFVLSKVHEDGSICGADLQNYNTSICLMALLAAHKSEYDPIILSARQWVIGAQMSTNGNGKIDPAMAGGVGYERDPSRSDLSNTLVALEALYYSKQVAADKNQIGAKDLDWNAAIHFIQSCQNLPEYNKESWASGDSTNKGGFIYYPGRSMAGSETNAEGRVAFRSYGSISYAGLLSYIYADLKHDDARVQAAFDWLRANYTVKENPALGDAGYYYYLHLMSKGLSTYGVNELEMKDGRKIDWRREVATRILNLQKADGSWSNDNNRWWEKDPALVTAYSVMSLEFLQRGL